MKIKNFLKSIIKKGYLLFFLLATFVSLAIIDTATNQRYSPVLGIIGTIVFVLSSILLLMLIFSLASEVKNEKSEDG